jgi:hypothetical protein
MRVLRQHGDNPVRVALATAQPIRTSVRLRNAKRPAKPPEVHLAGTWAKWGSIPVGSPSEIRTQFDCVTSLACVTSAGGERREAEDLHTVKLIIVPSSSELQFVRLVRTDCD